MERADISELKDFLIGQAQDFDAMTGCTAIIAPEGAFCGVDVRGGSPGTRDTDALDPINNRRVVHAVLLSGGSAYGLDAAGGLMRLLEEKHIGRDMGVTVVPNVCSAILFDLGVGKSDVRPDAAMGRAAGESAFRREPFRSGNFGVGTGATVGKCNGPKNAMKGGVGAAAYRNGDLLVGAVFAVNCVGDVLERGETVAGAREDGSLAFASSERLMLMREPPKEAGVGGNTVIGCIITNAALNKAQAKRLAGQGHNAIARAIRPAHSIADGDTVFAMCSGKVPAFQDAVSILAAHAAEAAILDAVKNAETYGSYMSYRERLERLK